MDILPCITQLSEKLLPDVCCITLTLPNSVTESKHLYSQVLIRLTMGPASIRVQLVCLTD